MPKKVIGIVGMPASGKSTAIEVAKQFGEIIVMGDVVREEVQKRGLTINSETLGTTARQLRETEGSAVIANRCVEKIKNSNAAVIILDGLRSMDEVRVFRESCDLMIIAVIAPDSQRHEWLLNRKREDDSTTMEKILERDTRELGFGIQAVIDSADFIINNLGTIEELQMNCKLTFDSVL